MIIILLVLGVKMSAQTVVGVQEMLYQRLFEEMDGNEDEGNSVMIAEDFEALLAEYERLREQPININSEEVHHLEELSLISAFQVEAVKEYRKHYGDLLFIEELKMIDEFDEQTVMLMAPIIQFGKSEWQQEQERFTFGKAITKGRHQLTLKYASKAEGKYTYSYCKKFRMGFAMKDNGFYGFHGYLSDIIMGKLRLESLAIGDYQVSFGQGLTMWSGFSFGSVAGGGSLMKRASGVRPKASASEGRFLRGAATTLKLWNIHATLFYSNRRSKNQQVIGGHLSYSSPQIELGCTAIHSWFDTALVVKPSKYNQFYFRGDHLTNIGLDFRWQLRKTVFFGEISMSENQALAGLAGMTCKPTGYINFSIMYRNYGTRYQNLFFGAIKASSRGQAEEGYHLSIRCTPSAGWELIANSDFFRLKWLCSQVYNPSWGQEHQLKVIHQIGKDATMDLQFKSKTRMKNSANDHVFSHYPIFYTRRNIRFQVSYHVTESWIFSDRISYTHYINDDAVDSRGYLLCHDIAYRPEDRPYSLTFRYALFSSDDYSSRISMYENDVLGSFSIPTFSGLGSRVYLLGRVKLFGSLSIYSRLGFTLQSDQTKVDWKAEVVWKIN